MDVSPLEHWSNEETLDDGADDDGPEKTKLTEGCNGWGHVSSQMSQIVIGSLQFH